MSYTKTEWVDNVTVVDAQKMNKIEDKLFDLDAEKVNVETGKTLTSNDFTNEYKSKLDSMDNVTSDIESIQTTLQSKVDKVDGKVLSTNDFTNELKSKVETIDNINTQLETKVDKEEGKGLSANDFTDDLKAKVETVDSINTQLETKVDKAEGKELSTNDFTDDLKTKVESIDDIQTKVEKLESATDIIEINSTDGSITLETNKIYRVSLNSDTTFTLPTINDNKFNQILVQAQVSSGIGINFGTDFYFGDGFQGVEGGYNFIFEHNGTDWVYGVVYIGG